MGPKIGRIGGMPVLVAHVLPVLLLGVCLCASQVHAQSSVRPVGNIVDATVPQPLNANWYAIQEDLLRFLPACNNVARRWWRALFHDAGTFNVTSRTGGVDGSLQFELGREENDWAQGTITVYKAIIASRTTSTFKPSMADMMALGGQVAFARCWGPIITFTPGRVDATTANGYNLLPSPTDSAELQAATARRMGFSMKEYVTLVGAGHTMADAEHHGLDSTPRVVDNAYFKELRAGTAPEILDSDLNLLNAYGFSSWIDAYAADQTTFMAAVLPAVKKMVTIMPGYNMATGLGMTVENTPTAADHALEASLRNLRGDYWSTYIVTQQPDECFNPAGFALIPRKDSPGNDIKLSYSAVLGLAEQCLAEPTCKSFNTNGWIKRSADATGDMSLYDVCEGLYRREAPAVLPSAVVIKTFRGLCIESSGTATGAAMQQNSCVADKDTQRFTAVSTGDGWYNLLMNGLCLDVSGYGGVGTEMVVWSCSGGTNQQFMFRPDGTGGFQILPRHVQGLCLAVPGKSGATLVQPVLAKCDLDNSDAQHFTFTATTPAFPVPLSTPIEVRTGTGSNTCMDVPMNLALLGIRIQQWTCNGGGAQKFTFVNRGNGYVSIHINNHCLDIALSYPYNGAKVVLWPCNYMDNQLFKLKPVTNGFNIIPKFAPTKCLDVTWGLTLAGTKIQTWECNGSTAQRMYILGARSDSTVEASAPPPPTGRSVAQSLGSVNKQSEELMYEMLKKVLENPTPVVLPGEADESSDDQVPAPAAAGASSTVQPSADSTTTTPTLTEASSSTPSTEKSGASSANEIGIADITTLTTAAPSSSSQDPTSTSTTGPAGTAGAGGIKNLGTVGTAMIGVGVAAGVAVLAAVGVVMHRRRRSAAVTPTTATITMTPVTAWQQQPATTETAAEPVRPVGALLSA